MTIGAVVWFAALALSAVRTSHPIVLADETAYLLPTLFGYNDENFARWEIVGRIPIHLYYRIYSVFAGPDLYLYAKWLNAAFVAGSALPAYLVARLYLSKQFAAAFAVIVICEPISSFVRYFMPESLYYFGFWWLIYLILGPARHSALRTAAGAGLVLGMLSLVKPHALALVIGTAAYLVLRPERWLATLTALVWLIVLFIGTRIGTEYALTGTWDFSLSGPVYGSQLAVAHLDAQTILFNAAGHIAGLLLLAGLPLALVLLSLIHPRPRHQVAVRNLMLLAICLILAMIAMTIYFSYVAQLGNPVGEPVTRLRGRYYAWALPLLMLSYLVLVRGGIGHRWLLSKGALAIFAGAAFLALGLLVDRYETGIVDFPELAMLSRWPAAPAVLASAAAACFGVHWVMRNPNFRRDSWRRALPLTWWASIMLITSLLLLTAPLAGKFAASAVDSAMQSPEMVGLRRRDDGMVIGTAAAPADTFRVLFHLASRSRARVVSPGSVIRAGDTPGDVNWLILLPGVEYSGAGKVTTIGPLQYAQITEGASGR